MILVAIMMTNNTSHDKNIVETPTLSLLGLFVRRLELNVGYEESF